jgi:hypothetical protein
MRIAASELQLEALSMSRQQSRLNVRVEQWDRGRAEPPRSVRVQLSDEGLKASQAAEAGPPDTQDPKLAMLIRAVEMLTGRPVRIFHARDLQGGGNGPPAQMPTASASPPPGPSSAPPRAGPGGRITLERIQAEQEQLSIQAAGRVRTADGQEIEFSLELQFERRFVQAERSSLQWGSPALKDPLMLDFAGPAEALQSGSFRFDLDADGKAEDVPLMAGRGFLVLDRNGNGRIDDGRELFGPTTGQGFAELARLDDDGNGWIDEADAAYSRLQVWRPGAEAGSLLGLKAADVGAISLAAIDAPFSVRNENNQVLGQMRSAAAYLRESGGAGWVQQVDLAV